MFFPASADVFDDAADTRVESFKAQMKADSKQNFLAEHERCVAMRIILLGPPGAGKPKLSVL